MTQSNKQTVDEGWELPKSTKKKLHQQEVQAAKKEKSQAETVLYNGIYQALGQGNGIDGWTVHDNTITKDLPAKIRNLAGLVNVNTHATININDFDSAFSYVGPVESAAAAFRRIQKTCRFHVTIEFGDRYSDKNPHFYSDGNEWTWTDDGSGINDDMSAPSANLKQDLAKVVSDGRKLFQ